MHLFRRTLLLGATFLACLSQAFSARNDGPKLLVNEATAIVFRVRFGGLSPTSRAELAAHRLHSWGAPPVVVKSGRSGCALLEGGRVLIRVGRADARASGLSLAELATRWTRSINDALSLPPVKFGAGSIVIPVGGTLRVPLVGSAALSALLTVNQQGVVRIQRTAGAVIIHGLSTGNPTLVASAPGAKSLLQIAVEPYAAVFPQAIESEVVGEPASADTVRSTIQGALRSQITSAPGASFHEVSPLHAFALAPSHDISVQVRVRADAPNALPAEGFVMIRVRNVGIERLPERELWYCNQPERLAAARTLFRGTLQMDRPVRLLYHHINVSDGPIVFRVDIANPSALPARIVVIPGDATPNPNPVIAGLDAAIAFLGSWLNGSGEIVTVPAGTSRPLALRRLARNCTTSGLSYLRLLDGGPPSLRVTVATTDTASLSAHWQNTLDDGAPWRETAAEPLTGPPDTGDDAKTIYPDPFLHATVDYRVGGEFGFLGLGQKSIPAKGLAPSLDGNFGVFYEIDATTENPSDKPADIEVVFESGAGYSGGLFVIDGKLRRISPLQPDGEAQLTRFRLESGQSRVVKMLTLPLSGSCYPATIIVRPYSPVP